MNKQLLESKNNVLHTQLILLKKKLEVAKTGLKLLISDGSDTYNVAAKTLQEIKKIDTPKTEI